MRALSIIQHLDEYARAKATKSLIDPLGKRRKYLGRRCPWYLMVLRGRNAFGRGGLAKRPMNKSTVVVGLPNIIGSAG